ncbi:hypothetical protein [Serratia liquefaciens]|uniref:hypothetical protein n=1 Tax=Serratia liquefaciens TaxID=614 RepID=UPI00165D2C12|nr:hypothetical protein [Serratia liquefaciens]QNQ52572.1 hypothetical protein IAI46_15085 [Serratia liquefaciens]
MRKVALLSLILLASTAYAEQWKLVDNGESISDGKLTISQLNGHYKVAFPGSSNPRSASISIDSEEVYGNEPYGFSGIHGDSVVKMLLSAKEASANYDDRYKTKADHAEIDLDSLRAVIGKIN